MIWAEKHKKFVGLRYFRSLEFESEAEFECLRRRKPSDEFWVCDNWGDLEFLGLSTNVHNMWSTVYVHKYDSRTMQKGWVNSSCCISGIRFPAGKHVEAILDAAKKFKTSKLETRVVAHDPHGMISIVLAAWRNPKP
jgi:hypothetical protein